jgi:hypothetical protein
VGRDLGKFYGVGRFVLSKTCLFAPLLKQGDRQAARRKTVGSKPENVIDMPKFTKKKAKGPAFTAGSTRSRAA